MQARNHRFHILFLINSLIWQKMDLYRELVWSSLNNGFQYSRIEEIDKIYNFHVGLNPKFDVVRGRTRPKIDSLPDGSLF